MAGALVAAGPIAASVAGGAGAAGAGAAGGLSGILGMLGGGMGLGSILGGIGDIGGMGAGQAQQVSYRNQLKLQNRYAIELARAYPSAQVEGLRAAGLNPILAASGGFHSGGQMARASVPANPWAGAGSRSTAGLLRAMELRQMVASTALAQNSAAEMAERRRETSARADLAELEKPNVPLRGQEIAGRVALMQSQSASALADALRGRSQAEVNRVMAMYQRLLAKQVEYQLPGARAAAEFWSLDIGPVVKGLQELGPAGALAGRALQRLFRQKAGRPIGRR